MSHETWKWREKSLNIVFDLRNKLRHLFFNLLFNYYIWPLLQLSCFVGHHLVFKTSVQSFNWNFKMQFLKKSSFYRDITNRAGWRHEAELCSVFNARGSDVAKDGRRTCILEIHPINKLIIMAECTLTMHTGLPIKDEPVKTT